MTIKSWNRSSILNDVKYENMLAGNLTLSGAYASIATLSFPSGTSGGNIQFNSIPQTFKHLQLRCFLRTDGTGTIQPPAFDFINGTQTYSYHYVYGDGTSVGSGGSGAQSVVPMPYAPATSATASAFGVQIIDILDYANTNKNKTIRNLFGFDLNGSGQVGMYSGAQIDAATPITQIRLRPYNATNFVQYSHFALYGVN